ncbi:hypothetical protein JAAARDRAFT_58744 [Jaapia argillacea MUCL 33604]|uniref:DUF6534 domain-containing protein n=1 Tax=Jaapia argillacea MUCL 33604 TaxID=933084 RepID=A0A067PR86_9AGAM|nr:hypothetical protein JAAARDRAFT_58744 [Jaapia argillacea MUCL 33604]
MSSIIACMQARPGLYIGADLANVVFHAFEAGIIVDLSVTFWSRADQESWVIRSMVAFVTVVAFFQTGTTFWDGWRLFVLNFGQWESLLELKWTDRLQSVMTVAMAAPVQCFLIRRCWILTNRSWLVVVPLSSMLLATVVISIYVVAAMFTFYFPSNGPAVTRIPVTAYLPVDIGLILSAVLDLSITTLISIFLLRSRSNAFTRRFKRLLRRLIMVSWEAAVLPCVCATVSAVLYMVKGNNSFWYLFFQAILGKFYAISFLVILNARADLQKPSISFNSPLDGHRGARRTPIANEVPQNGLLDTAILLGDLSTKTRSVAGTES